MMFETLVNSFDCKNTSESIPKIQEFVTTHSNVTSLPSLNRDKLRERLWTGLFTVLDDSSAADSDKTLCLTALKILIRDKTDLSSLVNKGRIDILLKNANLAENSTLPRAHDRSRIVEAVKCLYNIILNYKPSVDVIYQGGVVGPLAKRFVSYLDPDGFDVKLFDLKLAFLLTAFCDSARVNLIRNVGGLSFFNRLLESQLELLTNAKMGFEKRSQQQQMLCDEMKILFNVLLALKSEQQEGFCEPSELKSLVAVLREYLVSEIDVFGNNLRSDVINLMTLVPIQFLRAITSEVSELGVKPAFETGYLAVDKILDYLDKVSTDVESGNQSSKELLPPVLLLLHHLAQSGSDIRKYIRKRVLPKLTEADMFTRPEEGNTLRNKLCRLLTSPVTNITDVTADFLFVLCKESVGRMVKYTGYGNAAGLFARRGLMSRPLEYSSDSEGSDTEEYKKHKEFINPIVGCRTPNHPNPLEGMTEEQKEVLAMELVNSVDKLMRGKVIQPCVVGPDGRPEPIENVQQLQNPGPNEELNSSDED